MQRMILAAVLVCGIVVAVPGVLAGDVVSEAPDMPDPDARYLFYMHGGYPEKRGGNADYEYDNNLRALADKGFVVIGELRGPTNPRDYGARVAGQVSRLLEAGVPASQITVSGHSKGGFMTLVAAANLQNPEIKFGVMAACGRKGTRFHKTYRKFTKRAAANMRGRFLVAWAEDDDVAGDCDKALDAAGVTYENKILPAGGHRLFYRPDPTWIDLLAGFAGGR